MSCIPVCAIYLYPSVNCYIVYFQTSCLFESSTTVNIKQPFQINCMHFKILSDEVSPTIMPIMPVPTVSEMRLKTFFLCFSWMKTTSIMPTSRTSFNWKCIDKKIKWIRRNLIFNAVRISPRPFRLPPKKKPGPEPNLGFIIGSPSCSNFNYPGAIWKIRGPIWSMVNPNTDTPNDWLNMIMSPNLYILR